MTQVVGGAPPDYTYHTFGVPTIRSDLPAPRIKRVGDDKVCIYMNTSWVHCIDNPICIYSRTMEMRVMLMASCIPLSIPAGTVYSTMYTYTYCMHIMNPQGCV